MVDKVRTTNQMNNKKQHQQGIWTQQGVSTNGNNWSSNKQSTGPTGSAIKANPQFNRGPNHYINWGHILRAVMMINGNTSLEGLQPPTLKATGQLVLIADTDHLCLQNKQQQQALQVQQIQTSMWTTHMDSTKLPASAPLPPSWRGEMWSLGITTSHPARELLAKWS